MAWRAASGLKQVQPVTPSLVEAGRDGAQVGVQRGHELLAHGEERPAVAIPQRLADLFEEGQLGRPVGGIDRQDLLELVEDQHVAVPDALGRRRQPVQVVGQRQAGQLGQRRLCVLRAGRFQPQQQAEYVAVGAGRGLVGRQAGAHDGQDAKALGG